MKNFLIFLGSIFLALIVLVALGIGFIAMRGHALDKESKAYADAAIPAIFTTWLDRALLDRASPELYHDKTTAVQVYRMFRSGESLLGRLQKCEPAKGQSEIFASSQTGKRITATYTAKAQFEKGEATITLALIKHGDQWQIRQFEIRPPQDAQVMPNTALDKESKAYADAAIPAIVTKWSVKELLHRASPELKQLTKTDDLERTFRWFSSLGGLQKCAPAQGQVWPADLLAIFVPVSPQSGKTITAHYTARSQFEKGEATITLVLIKHGDQWQICGFGVQSPKLAYFGLNED
jgi:hypothetical protein